MRWQSSRNHTCLPSLGPARGRGRAPPASQGPVPWGPSPVHSKTEPAPLGGAGSDGTPHPLSGREADLQPRVRLPSSSHFKAPDLQHPQVWFLLTLKGKTSSGDRACSAARTEPGEDIRACPWREPQPSGPQAAQSRSPTTTAQEP